MLGMSIVLGVCVVLMFKRQTPLPMPRLWWLAVGATVLQIPVYAWGWSDWLLRSAYALLLVVAFANLRLDGGRLILAGLVLNALPILIYGRMPISQDMLAWGSQQATVGTALAYSKDVVIDRSLLLLLGDVLPIHVLGYKAAWSFGDLLLCLGVVRYCVFSHAPVSIRQAGAA